MGHRLGELARLIGGTVEGDPDRVVEGLATLECAGPHQLSFLTNPKYRKHALRSRAGALLVGPGVEGLDRDLLIAENPYYALAQLLEHLYPERPAPAGVHPTAVVDEGARIDASAWVGAYSVVGAESVVGAGALIHPHVVIGRDCRIGAGTVVHPQVAIYDGTQVGERCILHSGVVLGSDGFGYASRELEHRKLRQAGRVVIEDDVEIGSNSTVDRAMLDETRIEAGTKLDNLVHVGHNARIGRGSLLVAHVGVSGSTRLGRGVVLGGQSGVAGHLEIGDGVQVGAKTAVFQSVPAGKQIAGIPATDMRAWRRQQALVARLGDLRRRLRALEKKIGIGREEGGSET